MEDYSGGLPEVTGRIYVDKRDVSTLRRVCILEGLTIRDYQLWNASPCEFSVRGEQSKITKVKEAAHRWKLERRAESENSGKMAAAIGITLFAMTIGNIITLFMV